MSERINATHPSPADMVREKSLNELSNKKYVSPAMQSMGHTRAQPPPRGRAFSAYENKRLTPIKGPSIEAKPQVAPMKPLYLPRSANGTMSDIVICTS